MRKDVLEAWEIFMKLCEEFPELYDLYVKKVESEMSGHRPDPRIMAAARKRCLKNLSEKGGSSL